jgi:hypothetical protein
LHGSNLHRQGILKPSFCVVAHPQPSPVVCLSGSPPATDKGGVIRSTGWVQSQKWPVSFGPSSGLVVRDQGGAFWDGEDGYFPYPLGFFPTTTFDWALVCIKNVCLVVRISVSEMRIKLWLN